MQDPGAARAEPPALVPPLDERGAQVDVEHVHEVLGPDQYVRVEGPAPLVSHHADVVVLHDAQREAAQDDVAVGRALELAVLAQRPVQAERLADVVGLVALALALAADDLLQGRDVRVHLAEHVDDTVRPQAAVDAAAPMDVVRGDPQLHCCLSSSQPSHRCGVIG